MSADNQNPNPSPEQSPKPDTHSKRIKFRKTETSRLKAMGQETTESKPQVSLPTAPRPATPGMPERTSVVDPMALRDTNTSKVKRVQAAKDSSPLATVSLPGVSSPEMRKTETVQLKVVQQKKKELDEEMNPSSTVRLRTPTTGPAVQIPKPRPLSTPRDTMKISLPSMGKPEATPAIDAKTTIVAPPPTPNPTIRATPAQTVHVESAPEVRTSTQVIDKIKAVTKPGESGPPPGSTTVATSAVTEVVVPAGEAVTEEAAGESDVKPGTGGRMLKLRAGGRAARTVKVKEEGDQTVALEGATATAEEAATVKVEDAPSRSGGLKLRTRQGPVSDAPILKPAKEAAGKDVASPGIVYTLAAAASLVALGIVTFFLVQQVMAHVL